MNLLQFSQQSPPPIPAPAAPPASRWPVKIRWPAGVLVAVVGGQWRQLPDGRIEATYHNAGELEAALWATQTVREGKLKAAMASRQPAPPSAKPVQRGIFNESSNYYQEA